VNIRNQESLQLISRVESWKGSWQMLKLIGYTSSLRTLL